MLPALCACSADHILAKSVGARRRHFDGVVRFVLPLEGIVELDPDAELALVLEDGDRRTEGSLKWRLGGIPRRMPPADMSRGVSVVAWDPLRDDLIFETSFSHALGSSLLGPCCICTTRCWQPGCFLCGCWSGHAEKSSGAISRYNSLRSRQRCAVFSLRLSIILSRSEPATASMSRPGGMSPFQWHFMHWFLSPWLGGTGCRRSPKPVPKSVGA